MDPATLFGFILFAAVAGFTPGPNNLMLTASGTNHGFRRSVPHITGILFGFMVVLVGAAFGMNSLFTVMPSLHKILKILSIMFLVYLAWKIATSKRAAPGTKSKPLTFWTAAGFQLINPKGFSILLSAFAAFTSDAYDQTTQILVIMGVFAIVTLSSSCTWCLFGTMIGRFLKEDRTLLIFNIFMATMLLVSLIPIITA